MSFGFSSMRDVIMIWLKKSDRNIGRILLAYWKEKTKPFTWSWGSILSLIMILFINEYIIILIITIRSWRSPFDLAGLAKFMLIMIYHNLFYFYYYIFILVSEESCAIIFQLLICVSVRAYRLILLLFDSIWCDLCNFHLALSQGKSCFS